MTLIQTPRLLLRELTDADHEALFEMYQDPRMNRYLGGPPSPREEYWRKVRETWPACYARHGFGLWAAVRREDGRLMGRCGLLSQEVDGERQVDVAYALAPEFRGRGYATEAARASRDHAFRTLGSPHVISLILPDNTPSIRVAERNGMTFWKMADFRGYHVRVYRITRAEWEKLADRQTDAAPPSQWNTGTKDLDTRCGVGYFDTRFPLPPNRPIPPMRIQILRRAAVVAALLPLTMAAGCMSANKRLEQGMKLEERGRPADAARRYVDALRRDPNLADARARLQESGRLAVEQYLRESEAAAGAGAHDDAAESLLRLDDLRRDVAAVGVQLAVPADYTQHRRAVLDAAIEGSIDHGARLAESGRYSDALGRLERTARWQPSGEQRRQVDEARLDTYSGWMAAEASAGRHRGAYQVAERAISSLGRQFPGIERLVEAQEYALDEGTLRVAVLPIAASPSAERALTASFLRDVENELEGGAWARPPAFVEIVEPRDVRREARHFDLDDLGYTSETARLGRTVGADLVVMLEVDSVAITEPDPTRERRAARTRSGADTAYVVRSGRREGWTRVRYVVVSVDDRRIVSRDYVAPQASRSFREGEYTGDWRQLLLQDDDRRLFDPSRRDDGRANLMLELSRQLAEQLSREIYEQVLSQVR